MPYSQGDLIQLNTYQEPHEVGITSPCPSRGRTAAQWGRWSLLLSLLWCCWTEALCRGVLHRLELHQSVQTHSLKEILNIYTVFEITVCLVSWFIQSSFTVSGSAPCCVTSSHVLQGVLTDKLLKWEEMYLIEHCKIIEISFLKTQLCLASFEP